MFLKKQLKMKKLLLVFLFSFLIFSGGVGASEGLSQKYLQENALACYDDADCQVEFSNCGCRNYCGNIYRGQKIDCARACLVGESDLSIQSCRCIKNICEGISVLKFTDLEAIPAWAKPAVVSLFEQGIIKGNDDGSFAPDRPINRAEFSKILILATKTKLIKTSFSHFPDVPSSAWYHPYIETMYDLGWIEGHPDKKFHPEQTINRAEIAKMLAAAFGIQDKKEVPNKIFFDVDPADWFYPYVNILLKNGVLSRYIYHPYDPAMRFEPEKEVVRSEAVQAVYDAQNVKK